MRLFLILCLPLVLGIASCRSRGTVVEDAMSAVEAGDYTALVEGCGNQLIPGYTYCRKMEGSSTQELLNFHAPKTECVKEPCRTFKVFGPNGDVVYGGEFKRGELKVGVPWSALTGSSTFEISDRGFWGVIYEIKFIDSEGRERTTLTQGEIRMRVLKKEYIPLHNVSADKGFVWKWEAGVPVRMTTGGRTFVGRVQ